ncbi:24 kDa secreted protein [Aphelenchoides besseyi]|nr:24 kDa secreted protein [Aphelenchoides besseyi]
MRTVALLALLLPVCLGLRLTDKLSKEAGEILNEGLTNKTIRQCSCTEQHDCITEAKAQLLDCFHDCWHVVKAITNDTDGLKKCVTEKVPMLDNFVQCMEMNMQTCHASEKGPQVPYIDYNKVIASAEDRIRKQTVKLTKSVGTNVGKLVNVVLELGKCGKECYLKKNSGGFCFDRKSCQPKIEIETAVKSLKKCAATIKWKQTAGETCTCAVNAGVGALQQYCTMLGGLGRSPKSALSIN